MYYVLMIEQIVHPSIPWILQFATSFLLEALESFLLLPLYLSFELPA